MSKDIRQPVLVVEDDEETRVALRDLLEEEGYPVVEAENGQQALDIMVDAQAVEPCLIVLDMVLPRLSGWDFLGILSRYIRLSRIPVVIVSARTPEELEDGPVVAWIQKPFDIGELLSVVNAHASC
jgi:DNA-binding response OmpR family regulator